MQKKIRLIVAGAALGLAGVSATNASLVGQVDTFENGTTANWGGGASPTNIATGGPAGSGDHFLQVTSTGGFGGGSKLITFNRTQWLGDYTNPPISSITMDLEDLGAGPLSIRIAFKDGTGSAAGGYAYTNPFSLPADSAWHHATFMLADSSFTAVNSPAESFSTLLANPAEFRILSSASPALDGDAISASVGIDNISAITVPVPEPGGLTLLGLAGASLVRGRKKWNSCGANLRFRAD